MNDYKIFKDEVINWKDEIDYFKTIESGKLVIIGDSKNKRQHLLFLIFLLFIGLIITIYIVSYQLKSNTRETSDYIMSIGVILIFLFVAITGSLEILNRNRLEELPFDLSMISKEIIIQSLISVEWEPYLIKDNYIRVITKYSTLTERQTITLVFLPNGKIKFNSIRYPEDYIRAARFNTNFQILTDAINKNILKNSSRLQ